LVTKFFRESGHKISARDFKVVACEEEDFRRKVREVIEIRTRPPELNCDTGYNMPPVYSPLLSHDCRHHGGNVTTTEIFIRPNEVHEI